MTWSSYNHWNAAKLLVGITPTGVVSFIPPLWTGSISDKEIVKQSGLQNLLEAGDAVMADKGLSNSGSPGIEESPPCFTSLL